MYSRCGQSAKAFSPIVVILEGSVILRKQFVPANAFGAMSFKTCPLRYSGIEIFNRVPSSGMRVEAKR